MIASNKRVRLIRSARFAAVEARLSGYLREMQTMTTFKIGSIEFTIDLIKIYFDFWNAFCVSVEFGSYAARNMFP
jgi:hypothetical protein